MPIRRILYFMLSAQALACAASSPVPPGEDPYFPAALAVSPEDEHLFVLSANSDLKYGAGTIMAFDLAAVGDLATTWNGGEGDLPAGCSVDDDQRQLAYCPSSSAGEAGSYLVPSGVQIGNFGASLGVMEMDDNRLRLFSAVRGDPSVTWIDFDPASGRFDCTGERDFDAGRDGRLPRCDDRHRLTTLRDDEDFGLLSSEPFDVAVDGLSEHVMVSHLGNGRVTLVSAPAAPDGVPRLEDVLNGIWTGDSFDRVGAAGIAPRRPGDIDSLFYVTSNRETRINVVRAIDQVAPDGSLTGSPIVASTPFFYSPGPQLGVNGDGRGLVFSADGTRMYMVGRLPAYSILAFDTSLNPTGAPRNELLAQVEVCSFPADIAAFDDGSGLKLYVPCFASGQLWVINADAMAVEDIIDVGIGPSSIAISTSRHQAYVGNYGEDTVTVVDIDRTHPSTYHYGVLRLGKKRGE